MNKRKVVMQLKQNETATVFINALHRNRIKLFDMKIEDGEIQCGFYFDDIKKVRKIRRQYKVKLTFYYHSQRLLQPQLKVIIGFLLLIIVPAIAQLYYWDITIAAPTPEQRVKAEQSLKMVQLPLKKTSIDKVQKLADTMRQSVPHISWVHVTTKGSEISIALQPAPISTPIENVGQSQLIASKAGVIDRYFVTSGQLVIRRGDSVKPGDILVEDVLEQQAIAKVFANYWLTVKFEVPLKIFYYTQQSDVPAKKRTLILTEEHIDSHILPLVERKLLMDRPLETTLTLQKLLHLTFGSDTVKGEALYLVNENIAAPSSNEQGE